MMKSIILVCILASQSRAIGLESLVEIQFIARLHDMKWDSVQLKGDFVEPAPKKDPTEVRLRNLTNQALKKKQDYLAAGVALRKVPPMSEGVVMVRCKKMVLFVGPQHKIIAAATHWHEREAMHLLNLQVQKPKTRVWSNKL